MNDSLNILLIGHGGVGHPGGMLADALAVIHVNTKEKLAAIVSIPRDSWVLLPVRSDIAESHKINASFAIGSDDRMYPLKEPQYKGSHGGGEMAKVAAQRLTGLPIDYYAAIDFNHFQKAIDALGSIEVDVPVSFNDYSYPAGGKENDSCGFSQEKIDELHAQYSGSALERQFTCRYEHISFNKGPTQMDGTTALKFVRSRNSPEHGGDFARGTRTQAVLVGIKNRLLSLGAIGKIDDFYQEFKNMIVSDVGKSELVSALGKIGNLSDYQVRKISITTENFLRESRSASGQFILVPKAGEGNWSEVHKYIAEEIGYQD